MLSLNQEMVHLLQGEAARLLEEEMARLVECELAHLLGEWELPLAGGVLHLGGRALLQGEEELLQARAQKVLDQGRFLLMEVRRKT